MSNRVKIGAIGKNPLIEKINKLNTIDIQGYAVKRMEELLIVNQPNELDWYTDNLGDSTFASEERKDAK